MNSIALEHDASVTPDTKAYGKVTRRLIPFLIFCYVLAFIDRINIGFAQLQMKHDLGLSDTAYGLASSAFFIGYLVFEIPSNLLLHRIGARKTICRIMLCWGIISACTLFVRTPAQFLSLRFLLGAFEAGFSPGVLLYLTYWYPSERQGRAVGMFMCGGLIAGLIAGPVSSAILVPLDGYLGLRGWQWLFLLEGLPSTLIGIVAWFYITDRPANATWLSDDEKAVIERNNTAAPAAASAATSKQPWHSIFRNSHAFILSFCLFSAQAGSYVIFFWMPQMLKSFPGVSIAQVGFYSAIPYLAAMGTMIWWGKRSDQEGERHWHFLLALLVAAAGFALIVASPGSLFFTLFAFTIATSAILASIPVFWGAVSSALPPQARVAGIALITSLGSLGGLFSPTLIGFVRDRTGSGDLGLYIVTALMACGGLAIFLLPRPPKPQTAR